MIDVALRFSLPCTDMCLEKFLASSIGSFPEIVRVILSVAIVFRGTGERNGSVGIIPFQ